MMMTVVSIALLVVMVYSAWELLRLGVVEMVVGIVVVEDSHSKIVVVDKFDVVGVVVVGMTVVVVVVVVVVGKCKNFVVVGVACIVVVVLVAVDVEGGK